MALGQRGSTLDEMLADPIIQQMMRCDGVSGEDVRRIMAAVGRRLLQRFASSHRAEGVRGHSSAATEAIVRPERPGAR